MLVFHCLFQDRFDNPAGMEVSGKVFIELVDTSETSELPKLAGNTTSLRISLSRGFAVVQVQILQPNEEFLLNAGVLCRNVV